MHSDNIVLSRIGLPEMIRNFQRRQPELILENISHPERLLLKYTEIQYNIIFGDRLERVLNGLKASHVLKISSNVPE